MNEWMNESVDSTTKAPNTNHFSCFGINKVLDVVMLVSLFGRIMPIV